VAQRLPGGPGIHRGDPDAAARPDLQQPLGVQRAHRFADDRARHAELFAELTFGRQRVAGLELVGDDQLQDPVGYLVGQARLAGDCSE
jgi:hypothetical protein